MTEHKDRAEKAEKAQREAQRGETDEQARAAEAAQEATRRTPAHDPNDGVRRLDSRERFTLKQGTCVTVDGVEVQLVGDTEIESNQSDHDALAALAGTTFAEYPKRVKNADGVEKNVNGPEEEDEWLNPPPAGEPSPEEQSARARRTGLEDVTVESDAARDADLKAAAKRDADRKRK